MHDTGELLARAEHRGLHAGLVDLALGKVLEAETQAAHVERFGELRLKPRADDELGRAATDVDHQAPLLRDRQRVRHAEVNQPRFLAARDHLDRKAEHRARFAQELRRVLRDAQRIGADRAHALARKAAQALGELGERLERHGLRAPVDPLFGSEAAAQAHHFAHRVERIDLAIDHAPDLEVKTVRAEVDRGERVLAGHAANRSTTGVVTRLSHSPRRRNVWGRGLEFRLPMNRRIPTPAQFVNRELGQLAFNRRVLAQAADEAVPLLERLRFITIVSSNLDEFFEIRVAGLKESIKLGLHDSGPDARSAAEVFEAGSREAAALVAGADTLLTEAGRPSPAREGVVFPKREEWTGPQKQWIRDYYFRELLPVLTPIGLDPAHPFPRVLNKSLNFAVELEGRDAFGRSSRAAIVQAPRALPRLIRLPQAHAGAEYAFVFLSSILHAHVGELFAGMNVIGCYQFRVTRNSDLFVDEEEIKNLHTALQGELLHRHFGDAVRLEVADNCSERMVEFLLQQFSLAPADLYRVEGPVNLYRMREVPDQVARPDLKYPPFIPGLPPALDGADLFDVLKKQDVLLHHPFQSFLPVIDFIRTTANDPNVIAIKQTVDRTGTDSELMEILVEAARKGKEVTVVVELMARFDEEINMNWAARLEEVGAHVVYGVVGHQTHAKMSLILRPEDAQHGK